MRGTGLQGSDVVADRNSNVRRDDQRSVGQVIYHTGWSMKKVVEGRGRSKEEQNVVWGVCGLAGLGGILYLSWVKLAE